MRQNREFFPVIKCIQFSGKCADAHTVAHDMVHIDGEEMVISPVDELHAHERRVTYIKRLHEFGDDLLLIRDRIFSIRKECVHVRQDLLDRLAVDHKELRPEDLVAVYKGLKGILKLFRMHRASKYQMFRHVVEDTVGIHLGDEIGALLGRGHRIVFFFFCLRDTEELRLLIAAYKLCQFLRCRTAENGLERQAFSGHFLDPVHQSCGAERMAA